MDNLQTHLTDDKRSESVNWFRVIRGAGAFSAALIGSGYATGQEIMQFYVSHNLKGLAAAFITLLLLMWLGSEILVTGFMHRDDKVKGFSVLCGPYLGKFFEGFIVIFLFLVMTIIISGAGASLHEYYKLDYYIGCLIMIGLVLIAFFMGINRLLKLLSLIGPLIILFSIVLEICLLVKNGPQLGNQIRLARDLPLTPAVGSWALSGILYASNPLTGNLPFYIALGEKSATRKEARYSGIIGSILFMLGTTLMILAMLSDLAPVYDKEVPNIFLAESVSPVFADVFTIVLLLGIFSSSAMMMWTVCSRLAPEGTTRSRVTAVVVALLSFGGAQFSFGDLIGTIYPITGGICLITMFCIGRHYFYGYLKRHNLS